MILTIVTFKGDDGWYASCKHLGETCSAWGKTEIEALKEFHTAFGLMLEVWEQDGIPNQAATEKV